MLNILYRFRSARICYKNRESSDWICVPLKCKLCFILCLFLKFDLNRVDTNLENLNGSQSLVYISSKVFWTAFLRILIKEDSILFYKKVKFKIKNYIKAKIKYSSFVISVTIRVFDFWFCNSHNARVYIYRTTCIRCQKFTLDK
jgi:hypothetical protein